MLLRKRPGDEFLNAFVAAQAGADLSYPDVGATAGVMPRGYKVNRRRIRLGAGAAAFESARAALRQWRQFGLGWVEICPPAAPLAPGQTVAILARMGGLWWLNACRIVYLIDEHGEVDRFGFAYGTLPQHAVRGEERFSVEWHHADDSVWFDIVSFSRPQRLIAWLAYPAMRWSQNRFCRQAVQTLQRASATPPV